MLLSAAGRRIFQSHGEYDFPEPIPRKPDCGLAFRRTLSLPAGRHGWLVQWQVDQGFVSKIADVSVEIADLETDGLLAHVALSAAAEPITLQALDGLTLVTKSAKPCNVVVRGTVSGALGHVRLRHLKVIELGSSLLERQHFEDLEVVFQTRWLKSIFIGTTNVCNANCPHCPTNKKMTAHLDRGCMSMDLFERIIRQLDGVTIGDSILFGVFGEPFADPLLEQRIGLIRQFRPDLPIDIVTNAGLADAQRVATIAEHIRVLAIHIEATTPDLYNKLMWPLKAAQVFPTVDEILAIAGNRVTITTPLHRANCHEASAIRHRWGRRGNSVLFNPLQTRATDRTSAKQNALAPTAGFWRADLVDLLVIDWDGTVLLTCDDFLRRQPLGNLRTQSLKEILDGEPRRQAFDDLRSYRWTRLPSIYDSIVDDVRAVDSYGDAGVQAARHLELSALSFQTSVNGTRGDSVIKVHHDVDVGTPAVFGPYVSLPIGRYVVRFRGTACSTEKLELNFEVVSGFGQRSLGLLNRKGAQLVSLDLAIEFSHDYPDETLEFRIVALKGQPGESFTFQGVSISRVGS